MADKPVLKIQIPADYDMVMDIYEESPNQLVFEMYPRDVNNSGGGRLTIETTEFMELFNKLVRKE